MKIRYLFFVAPIVVGILLSSGTSIASMPGHPPDGGQPVQSTAGGATAEAVSSTIINPVSLDPAFSLIPPPPPTLPGEPAAAVPKVVGAVEVGFQTLYSTHIQVYRIPLSYAFTENIKLELGIPYVKKQLKGEYTGKELTADGLGDISIGAKYRYGDANKIQGMTSFYLKLPTGQNKQFENRNERLALGTGSYDFIINQTVTALFGKLLLVANLGYSFNTDSDYTEMNDRGLLVKYENRAGNAFNYLIGAEYYTPVRKLMTYTNLSGIIKGRSHIKETNEPNWSFFDRNEDKKDRLRTLDLIAGVKYSLTEKIVLRLGFIAPVWTGFDPDSVDTKSREWLLDFGFSGRF